MCVCVCVCVSVCVCVPLSVCVHVCFQTIKWQANWNILFTRRLVSSYRDFNILLTAQGYLRIVSLHMSTEDSMLSSDPWCFPRTLLIWPPLTSGMPNDFTLILAFRMNVIRFMWLQLIYLVLSEHVPLLVFKVLFRINQSPALLLCFGLWGKIGSHCPFLISFFCTEY